MKKLLHTGFILSAVCVLHSCKTSSVTTTAQKHETVDSVTVIERQVAVPVYIPGDTITMYVPIECDSNNRVKDLSLKTHGKRGSIDASIRSGYITIISDCRAYVDSLYQKEVFIKQLRSKLDSSSFYNKVTVKVPVVPNAYKYAMWYTVISVLLIVLYIIYRIIKIYAKWQIPI